MMIGILVLALTYNMVRHIISEIYACYKINDKIILNIKVYICRNGM